MRDYQQMVVGVLPPRDQIVVLGLDVGESASMTCATIYSPISGRLEVYGAFPDRPGLAERGQGDGCGSLYCEMQRRGELVTFEGRTTDIGKFLKSLSSRIGDSEVGVLLADRFRDARVLEVIESLDVGWPIQWRGMGWKDGSNDIDDCQNEILEGRPKVLDNLMLQSAIVESKLVRDPAGNKKINRATRRGRIDALASTILALAAGRRLRPQLETRREPRITFLS